VAFEGGLLRCRARALRASRARPNDVAEIMADRAFRRRTRPCAQAAGLARSRGQHRGQYAPAFERFLAQSFCVTMRNRRDGRGLKRRTGPSRKADSAACIDGFERTSPTCRPLRLVRSLTLPILANPDQRRRTATDPFERKGRVSRASWSGSDGTRTRDLRRDRPAF
jgi:hypothetical protein